MRTTMTNVIRVLTLPLTVAILLALSSCSKAPDQGEAPETA